MAWNDQWDRILPERLPHVPCKQLVAQPFGDFAVSQYRTRRDRTCDLVDLTIKGWKVFGIDGHVVQIGPLPTQQRANAIDCVLHIRWRSRLPSAGEAAQQACTGRAFATVRNLYAGNTACGPDDAART